MGNREEIRKVIDLYIKGINDETVAIIPLTGDVEFHGPMLPQAIAGEADARAHLAQLAPFFNMKLVYLIVEDDTAAAMMDIVTVSGVEISGATFFKVLDGKICFVQNFSDTHRLFKGGS